MRSMNKNQSLLVSVTGDQTFAGAQSRNNQKMALIPRQCGNAPNFHLWHSCKAVVLTRVVTGRRQPLSETKWRSDMYSPKAGSCP